MSNWLPIGTCRAAIALRSDWIRAWLIAGLKTHTFAPNGEGAVPGHTLGADTRAISAELETDSDLGGGAPTETDPTAVTTGTASVATAAMIVTTDAIRPMVTRPGTGVLLCLLPRTGDPGAAGE